MAAKELKVKPAEGLTIEDPETGKPLPAGKASIVPKTRFWLRRLAVGDVIDSASEKPADNKKD